MDHYSAFCPYFQLHSCHFGKRCKWEHVRFVPENPDTWPSYEHSTDWELWCKYHGGLMIQEQETCVMNTSTHGDNNRYKEIFYISIVRFKNGYDYTYTKILTREKFYKEDIDGELFIGSEIVKMDFKVTKMKM